MADRQNSSSNHTAVPTCPFECTVDLLKFVQSPVLKQYEAWREVMEWLRNRINAVEGIPWTDVLFLAERLAAGQSPTGNRGPYGPYLPDLNRTVERFTQLRRRGEVC